jgi:hypothetical protein
MRFFNQLTGRTTDLTQKRDFSTKERKQLAKEGKALPDGSYPIENGEDLQNAIDTAGMGSAPKKEIKAHIEARAKALGLESKLPESWKEAKKVDLSAEARANLINGALKNRFGMDNCGLSSWWVAATYDDYVVVNGNNGKLFKMPYTIDGDNVTLGDPQEVVATYQPVAAQKEDMEPNLMPPDEEEEPDLAPSNTMKGTGFFEALGIKVEAGTPMFPEIARKVTGEEEQPDVRHGMTAHNPNEYGVSSVSYLGKKIGHVAKKGKNFVAVHDAKGQVSEREKQSEAMDDLAAAHADHLKNGTVKKDEKPDGEDPDGLEPDTNQVTIKPMPYTDIMRARHPQARLQRPGQFQPVSGTVVQPLDVKG